MNQKPHSLRRFKSLLKDFSQKLLLIMSKAISSRTTPLALTETPFNNILLSCSEQQNTGLVSRLTLGSLKPHSQAVFLCPKKSYTVRVNCFGNSKELPFLDTVYQTKAIRRSTQGIVSGGLNFQILGVTEMTTINPLRGAA